MTAPKKELRDEPDVLRRLETETGLGHAEAALYLRMLREGHISVAKSEEASKLLDKGMAIISGDGGRIIPVHPRLGIANQYRAWREAMVREIGERRQRADRLILELIPLYEAATVKRMETEGA